MDQALKGVIGWKRTEFARKKELVAFRDQDVRGVVCRTERDSDYRRWGATHFRDRVEPRLWQSICRSVYRASWCGRCTGEILAMATLPNFDPNDLEHSVPEGRRNRVITDTAEPGSTFKIVVISGALE